jgi:hypothetical protein
MSESSAAIRAGDPRQERRLEEPRLVEPRLVEPRLQAPVNVSSDAEAAIAIRP